MVYRTCLTANVTPKGLWLKKEPCLGKVSYGFTHNRASILREAQQKLIVALKSESSAMQCRVSREFHAKMIEYTRSYGDQTVKHWSTQGWEQNLAARHKQSSKYCLAKSKIEDVGHCRQKPYKTYGHLFLTM